MNKKEKKRSYLIYIIRKQLNCEANYALFEKHDIIPTSL